MAFSAGPTYAPDAGSCGRCGRCESNLHGRPPHGSDPPLHCESFFLFGDLDLSDFWNFTFFLVGAGVLRRFLLFFFPVLPPLFSELPDFFDPFDFFDPPLFLLFVDFLLPEREVLPELRPEDFREA